MTELEFKLALLDAVEEWIGCEESFDDDPCLAIRKPDLTVEVVDGEVADTDDSDVTDYYSVMEFVAPSSDGGWIPDTDALRDLVREYFQ